VIHEPVDPSAVPTYIRICAGILFCDTLSTFPFVILRGFRRPLKFITIKTINVATNLGLNILFIGYLQMSIAGILWANLIASALTVVIMIPDIAAIWKFEINRPLLREMLSFGLPNIPTYLFVMITELADRKILEIYSGISVAGLFSAGYKLGMFMAVVTAAFRFAWQPFFLSHANDPEAPQLFARVMTYYLFITAALFQFLTFFMPPLLYAKWPGIGYIIAPEFWAGLSVFPIILLAHIFDGVYANLMPGVYIKKLTKRLPFVTGTAALVNVVGNLLLIPRYGMMAAAWTTLAAFVVQAVLLWVLVRSAYTVPYEWSRILKLTLACGVLTLLGLFPPFNSLWIRVVLFLSFIPLLLLSGFLNPSEKGYLRRVVFAR
jgi:O-antigen/teichoic acid export membrane protein